MKATVKAAYYDRLLKRQVLKGETVDLAAKRIDEVNAAFPGTLEKQAAKKAAPKKEA